MCMSRRKLILLSLLNLFKPGDAEMEGFIVGGDYVSIAKFPHSAYLAIECRTKGKPTESWGCGSSILNQRLLLTAAHCVDDCVPLNKIRINVAVGNENRNVPKMVPASKFAAHPDYDTNTLANDIAMIKMMKPIVFNANVKRVALMKNPPYKERATVAGWGLTNEDVKIASQYLKEAKQTLLPHDQCVKLLGTYMHKGTICAQQRAGKSKDVGWAAEGDSGSALVVRGYIQIGLVSFKLPSVSASVVVYTDIVHFYEWITIVAKNLYCT